MVSKLVYATLDETVCDPNVTLELVLFGSGHWPPVGGLNLTGIQICFPLLPWQLLSHYAAGYGKFGKTMNR